VVDDVVHYCVANMPGAVAHTSTWALTHATLPFALELANKGYRHALREHSGLRDGLNVHLGCVTNPYVAGDLGYAYVSADDVLLPL
jgi:alanine dehydrogenase